MQKIFDQYTVDAVQWFYARIEAVYGADRYKWAFPSDAHEKASKREWAERIGSHTRNDLDRAIQIAKDGLKNAHSEYQRVNVGLILGGAKPLCASHRITLPALPEPDEQKNARRAAGLAALAELKKRLTL